MNIYVMPVILINYITMEAFSKEEFVSEWCIIGKLLFIKKMLN